MASCLHVLFGTLFVLVHSSTPRLAPIPSIAVNCPDTLTGHWECGRQIGEHFRDRIAMYFSKSDHSLYERVKKGGLAQQVFNAMKATAQRIYPEYFQELDGTAVGAGQPLDLLLCENFAQEIDMALAGDSRYQQLGYTLPDRCTDVFTDSAFAHNEDGGIEDFYTIYFVRMRTYSPEGGTVENFAGITYAGRLPGWGPGWNSHGLTWSSNVMYLKPSSPARDGLSVTFVSRDTVRSSSIEEFIRRSTPVELMAGQNMNVGSLVERRVVTVETIVGGTWDKLEVKENVSPTFHANEYLRMNVTQDEGNPHLTSARHRHAAYSRSPTIKDASGLLHFLGDTSDPVFPVFRRNDTTQEYTLFTVLFDLARGTAEFYRANPRLGESSLLWREYISPSNQEKVIYE